MPRRRPHRRDPLDGLPHWVLGEDFGRMREWHVWADCEDVQVDIEYVTNETGGIAGVA